MLKAFQKKIKKLFDNNKFSAVTISIISFIAILLFSTTEVYKLFEYKLYDLRFKIKPLVHQWDFLSFINIDESSVNNIGKFPWPRNIYAEGLRVLRDIGIKQITFDIEFPDISPPVVNSNVMENLRNKIKSRKRIRENELTAIIQDNDKILAKEISKINKVILPFHFKKEKLDKNNFIEDYKIKTEKEKKIFIEKASVIVPEERLNEYRGFIDSERVSISFPIPELVKASYSFGFVDRDPDIDGSERKIRMVRLFNGRLYFCLALVMLMDICSVEKEDIQIEPGDKIILKNALNPITHQIEDINIPINNRGMLYINWAGPGPLEKSFHHISFYALIEYPLVKEEIYDYFDEQEIVTGNRERSRLYDELDKRFREYHISNNLSLKRENWKKILEIRGRIRNIEKNFANPIISEIKKIKEELKSGKNQKLEDVILDLNNYLTAINIVVEVESLQDKISIIGLTATGTQDLGVIPIYNKYMMVGTFHNVINTILNKNFIIKLGRITNYTIMFILAIIIVIIMQYIGARMSLAIILSSLIAINLLCIGLFTLYNIWMDELGVNLSLFIPSVILSAIKFIKEETKRRFIKSAFSHYLSPQVIDEIIQKPDLLKLGGESRELTIFFSDVARFSSISEVLSPSELVQLLNEYLSEMTDIILSYNGTIDKYEGDAIMAFFGAPQNLKDHTIKSCYAAIDMQKTLEEMRAVWRKNGKHELFARMGINSGEAVVGNMGSRTRMDYTVMGDSVNLASRLEGANKHYSTYMMISESVFEKAKDHIETRILDTIKVVGKDIPIQVYELLGRKGDLSDKSIEILDTYNSGLEYFHNREWKKAKSKFNMVLKIDREDGPSRTYYNRCSKFILKPPSKKWDGIYTLKSK